MEHACTLPPILTIAGSDSSGGAGIQADLKTIQALGGYGMSAITALTAQNTLGVGAVHPVPPEFVAKQITAVLDDISPKAIKTGMLANAEIIAAVAQCLKKYGQNQQAERGGMKLIIDPVMIAKGGASLLEENAVVALKEKLLPLATIVTPNIPEAEVLSGLAITSIDDMQRAAEAILKLGPKAALIKGGHLNLGDGLVHNLLLTQSGEQHLHTSRRIESQHTHGTGCTLSAAIATLLGVGWAMEEAFKKAEAYVAGAIKHAPGLGGGHGPLHHHWDIKKA